jgi:catalase
MTPNQEAGTAPAGKSLAEQIIEIMIHAPGVKPGHRPVHAKGIVCKGTFAPSPAATALSRAAHFRVAVPIIVRFSDGAADPAVADNSPDVGPRGLAIRFELPGGQATDIVAMSHNGFIVGTGEEFLALQQAVKATDPSKPHPWPIEQFLGAHPRALKFVQDNQVIAVSFATSAYFSNNSFVFVNQAGGRQTVRYQILPAAGRHDLGEAEAKDRSPNFMVDELKTRLAAGPVQFKLVAQLPNPGDLTSDSSLVWPDDRRTAELGTITLNAVVPDSAAAERALAFFPTNLTDGIELSDDPLPALRSDVYALSEKFRRAK